MTDQRELDRLLGAFFVEGTEELADRVIGAALDHIDHIPQRRAMRAPWRFQTMTMPTRVAAAAVIGVLAVGGALYLIRPDQPAVGGPSPTSGAGPGPSRPASPSAGPSLSGVQQRPGWILLEHFGNAADGTALTDTQTRHLWLVKADGTELHELAPGSPATGKGPADWSPDGTHIAFSTTKHDPLIYETDVNGTTPRLISTTCAGSPATCLEFFPAYSPDGKRMAFIRLVDSPSSGVVGIRDIASGRVTLLESTRQAPPTNELGAPAWSPDGRQLVYYQVAKDADGKPTGSSEMYVVNADDTGLHKLDPGQPAAGGGDPAWSPDGSLIVFSSYPIHEWNDTGTFRTPDVYTVHPDGTGVRRLTNSVGSGSPSWTADGRIFYFSNRAMWLMDADGSNQRYVGPGTLNLVSDTTGYSYYGYWQPTP